MLGCLVATAGGSIGNSDVGASFREENQVTGRMSSEITRYIDTRHTHEI